MKGIFNAALFLLVIASFAHADQLADDLANYNAGLNSEINVSNAAFTASPQSVLVNVMVRNPYQSPLSIYLLRQDSDGWKIVNLIGTLGPHSKNPIELEVEVHYDKLTKKNTRYVIAGRGEDGKIYGSSFEINEDWTAYEKEMRGSLSRSVVLVVPLIALVLIVILLAAVYLVNIKKRESDSEAYLAKSTEGGSGVAVAFEKKTAGEYIAGLMVNPVILFFEIAMVCVLIFVMFETVAQVFGPDDGLKIMLLSAAGAFSIPFLYFICAWYLERTEEGKPAKLFIAMFVWGMFSAFLSLLISSSVISGISEFALIPSIFIITMLVAPVVEETVKGLGVLAISGHKDFDDTLTGMLLGFTCGIGFAFIENWFYFSFKTNPFDMGLASWSGLIIYRSFFNALAHGCFTATVAAIIGYAKSTENMKRFATLAFIPGLFIAIAIHMIYNLSALADNYMISERNVPFFMFNPMLIILLASLLFLVLVFALIDEKKRKVAASENKNDGPRVAGEA